MQTEHLREGSDLDDFLESLRGDVNPEGIPGVPHVEGWVPPATAARSHRLRGRFSASFSGGCLVKRMLRSCTGLAPRCSLLNLRLVYGPPMNCQLLDMC